MGRKRGTERRKKGETRKISRYYISKVSVSQNNYTGNLCLFALIPCKVITEVSCGSLCVPFFYFQNPVVTILQTQLEDKV